MIHIKVTFNRHERILYIYINMVLERIKVGIYFSINIYLYKKYKSTFSNLKRGNLKEKIYINNYLYISI